MRFLLAVFFLFTLTLVSVAQQPSPTPVEDNEVVKITTNLIQLDVTVTDKRGKFVTDLKPEDFEIFENGQRREITNFSIISQLLGAAVIDGENTPSSALTNPTGQMIPIKRTSVRRTLALVVDDMNLSFASIYYTRQALKEFVEKQMQPGDLVAIVRTGGSVGSLQQFTSDKRLLLAAIEKIRWNSFASNLNALSSVGQNDADISERFVRESSLIEDGNSKSTTILLPREISPGGMKENKIAQNTISQEKGIYAQTSLGALRHIISGMKKMPGRKAMMVFSDGITVGEMTGKGRSSSVFGYLQDVVEDANKASVVVYTFDAKGLANTAISASDSTYEIIDGHRDQKLNARIRDLKESQDGLVYFAERTGGRALLNSDNFNRGMQRALDEQAGYYLLGYVPDSDSFDAEKHKFNKIEIKVKRPGMSVSYRSGFFSNSANAAPSRTTARSEIADALMSPFASSDIAVNVNALYAEDPADGAYVRSFIHIDVRSLTFTDTADGWKTSEFEVVAMMTDSNGTPVKDVSAKYTIRTRGQAYESTLANGFVYLLVMPTKNNGLFQYRVAVRDAASGKIGSASQLVEIPDLAKRRLLLSNLAVENVSLATWQSITAGKVGNGAGQLHLPSTLQYDTVLRKFPAGSVLRYGMEIYNAKTESDGTNLIVQANITQNDKVIVAGKMTPFDTANQLNKKFLRLSGAMMLDKNLAPGEYVLQLNVFDRHANRNSTQYFPFEIVK